MAVAESESEDEGEVESKAAVPTALESIITKEFVWKINPKTL
jgi:hypothetical protein